MLFNKLRGLFAEVAHSFKREPTGYVIGFVFWRRFQIGRPTLGGLDEFGKGFADVAVAGAVVVEVVL